MPKVTYIEIDGTEHTIEVSTGTSLMQAAINHLIPGIEGDCGGLCACGTCHVYIKPPWPNLCAPADELETSMLEFAYDVSRDSRLSCQLMMSDELDGITVHLPKRQY